MFTLRLVEFGLLAVDAKTLEDMESRTLRNAALRMKLVLVLTLGKKDDEFYSAEIYSCLLDGISVGNERFGGKRRPHKQSPA